MKLRDKVVVVTGGGRGIGEALCQRFAAEAARAVVVVDRLENEAKQVARDIGGMALVADVAQEADIQRVVKETLDAHGQIDLFCSNAGILTLGDENASDEAWQRTWDVNVMAHVYAARAVLPGMLARKEGYLLATASAAGLLTQLGAAPYAVTKHAVIAFAEWLAVTYGDAGINVSCLCPLGVQTDMLQTAEGPLADHLRRDSLHPLEVADAVVRGLAEERFLIFSHPEAAEFYRRKCEDRERWMGGMRRLKRSLLDDPITEK